MDSVNWVNSSNPTYWNAAPWYLYLSFSLSRYPKVSVAPLGKW